MNGLGTLVDQNLEPSSARLYGLRSFVVQCVPHFSRKQSFSLSPRPGRDCHRPGLESPLHASLVKGESLRHHPKPALLPVAATPADPTWLQDCPDRFPGFLFTESWFPGHSGGVFSLSFWLYFFSNSTPYPHLSLFSLPSQSLPGCYQSPGQRPRVPDFISTPMPKTLGPFPALGPLPGQPGCDPEVSIYLRHKIINNYMTRNASNNTSHLLGTSQT